MPATWMKVDEDVIELCEELIDAYHPWLRDMRIGLIFRSEASNSRGKQVWGKAAKVDGKTNALLPEDEKLDFLIWLAKDIWDRLPDEHKRALLDHELCHCGVGDNGPMMVSHDLEEFTCIVERHGLWSLELGRFAKVVEKQLALPGIAHHAHELERMGAVLSVHPGRMNGDADPFYERAKDLIEEMNSHIIPADEMRRRLGIESLDEVLEGEGS